MRVYICHTYYHIYVALLKECALPDPGNADFLLSSYSNDFENLHERLAASSLCRKAFSFEEHGEEFFSELKKWHVNRGAFLNLFQRIIYFRKQAKLLAPFIPVDLKQYEDIYVFCDSDPIGYYLNAFKIPYHALEDGLDCLRYYDTARYDNRGMFPLKVWMAKHNIIFIQNGYAKYCLDMEVNAIEQLMFPVPKVKEESREKLADRLTKAQKEMIIRIFLPDADKLIKQLEGLPKGKETVLILTEPLCDMETRKRIFLDISKEYGKDCVKIFKVHPRDVLDYRNVFPEDIVLAEKFPMEVLNFLPVSFDRVVSVFTVPDQIRFAKRKIFLGEDFMDRYEAPEIHRQNETI